MTRPTPKDPIENIQPDVSDENDEREHRMEQSIAKMARTPGSGIAMCHEQGKTAVYLSEDKTCIVEHPPHGPITRTPLDDCDSIAAVSEPRLTVVIGANGAGKTTWGPQASRDAPPSRSTTQTPSPKASATPTTRRSSAPPASLSTTRSNATSAKATRSDSRAPTPDGRGPTSCEPPNGSATPRGPSSSEPRPSRSTTAAYASGWRKGDTMSTRPK